MAIRRQKAGFRSGDKVREMGTYRCTDYVSEQGAIARLPLEEQYEVNLYEGDRIPFHWRPEWRDLLWERTDPWV